MRYLKILLGIVIILPFIISCNKDFSINADWKDITIVYGLLSQNDSVHYLKITKAFLGKDNTLYAKIPDSSNFPPGELLVWVDEYDEATLTTIRSIPFDTITLHTKEPGHSIFYFPDQLVYQSNAKLNEKYTYKLFIHNNRTGKDITSQTKLVNNFSISQPDPYATNEKSVFLPGVTRTVEWSSAKEGRRYQLVIRFHYSERPNNDPQASLTADSLDWLVFSNELSKTTNGGETMVTPISGSTFYSAVAANIKVDTTHKIQRYAGKVDYIFSVGSENLNTYMEVTEPSSSIVQYRPPFTNITNGIGLFSSRFVQVINSRSLSDETKAELKVNPKTKDLDWF